MITVMIVTMLHTSCSSGWTLMGFPMIAVIHGSDGDCDHFIYIYNHIYIYIIPIYIYISGFIRIMMASMTRENSAF